MRDPDEQRRILESEIERRLAERFAALRDEFERLRMESDGRWAGFTSRFEQRIKGIVPEDLLPEPERPSEPGQLSIAAARELDDAATQVEILHRLLELCRRYASRAILLVVKNGAWIVWKASGLSGGAAQEAVRRVTLPAVSDGPLSRVLAGVPCRLAASNEVSARLSCADAAEAVVVPMTIRERISGAVYADAARGEEDRFDPEAIALLTYLAGLLVDRLPVRKMRPSPSLKEAEHAAASPESPLAPATAEYDTRMLSLWQEPADARPPEPQPPARDVPAAAPRPAAGPRRLTGPLAPPEEDEQRAEARRFAELLVSEIKLYNERAVREGREQGNLYRRLKEEIDLSRQLYEQRIPQAVRAGSDFLRDELVRILAEGRPEALGM